MHSVCAYTFDINSGMPRVTSLEFSNVDESGSLKTTYTPCRH